MEEPPILNGSSPSPPLGHPVPAEDPEPVVAESRPVYPAPETAPSEASIESEDIRPAVAQHVGEADINWAFDDMSALQAHIAGKGDIHSTEDVEGIAAGPDTTVSEVVGKKGDVASPNDTLASLFDAAPSGDPSVGLFDAAPPNDPLAALSDVAPPNDPLAALFDAAPSNDPLAALFDAVPSNDPLVSLFDAPEANTNQAEEDFFGQIGQPQQPVQEVVQEAIQGAAQEPVQKAAQEPAPEAPAEKQDDLTARWQAALAGDGFLANDDEDFLPSDDEGFLSDSDDEPPTQKPDLGTGGGLGGVPGISAGHFAQDLSARYVPQVPPQSESVPQQHGGAWPTQPPAAPQQDLFSPHIPAQAYQAPATNMSARLPSAPYPPYGARPPPLPEKKAQSFVNKREGYQSPYDLPMDIGPPVARRRPSNIQQTQNGASAGVRAAASTPPPPPMRSSSRGAAFPTEAPTPALLPRGIQGPAKPRPLLQQNFFEELPISPPKPRATSAMGRYPDPTNRVLLATSDNPARPGSTQGFYQSPQRTFAQPVVRSPQQTFVQPSVGLAPQPTTTASRYSPAPRAASGMYAPPPASLSATAPASTRYSPVPGAAPGYQPPPDAPPVPIPNTPAYTPAPQSSAPPATGVKYAPRPAGPPQVGSRIPSGGAVPPSGVVPHLQGPGMMSAPILPPDAPQYQPNTASPPSQFPRSPEDPHHIHSQRRISGEHHAMHSSRPGTARSIPVTAMDVPREEEEESTTNTPEILQRNGYPTHPPQSGVPPPTQSRYAPPRGSGRDSPASIPPVSRQNTFTPPPVSQSSKYTPNNFTQRTVSPEATFQPPPRAQTQSPGLAYGKTNRAAQRPRDPYERPSSAFAHSSITPYASVDFHQRHQSLGLSFIPPTDETASDVLQRWQGAPVFCWGFGGNVAVTFPKRAQRYTSDMQQPMIKCSPGEVKIRNIREILPVEDVNGKFPGPAWGGGKSTNKAKKKEILGWLAGRIEELAQEEGQKAEERVLLWKIMKVLLENDGVLEGNPEVEKAVRAILTPEAVAGDGIGEQGSFSIVGEMPANTQGPTMDRVDAEDVKTIKANLLKGNREAAVWHAVDRRLWSHALLISGTVGRDLWKQVVQEFVKHEVKTLGEETDSLAALYEVFAGNCQESVDELVSASARLGMPMLGSSMQSGGVNIDQKLDRWRETLGLVLSNRSPGDVEAILALGRLLVGYGRVEAGHICYLFARQGPQGGAGAVFSGHDDPASSLSLLGVDPRNVPFSFSRDIDSIMLSEIFELAVSLAPTPGPAFPHLQGYKLQCAMVLAENGHKVDAQKYCDSIASAVKAWNKPSPYFHSGFFSGLQDLSDRLSMSPKDSSPTGSTSGNWIPKLNSDTVSNSLWGTFNKFVAGEEEEASNTAAGDGMGMMDAVASPFAKMAGSGNASPEISRVQSGVDLYSAYNSATSYTVAPPMANKPTSQAASRYGPTNSYQPKSNLYEPAVNQRSTSDAYTVGYGEGYGGAYEANASPYAPQQQLSSNPYDSLPSSASPGYPGTSGTYDSRSSFEDAVSSVAKVEPEAAEAPSYEPPAGGYEPPSSGFTPYQPDNAGDDDDTKPKPKKSFMEDGDDDEFTRKAMAQAKKLQEEEAKKKAEEEKNSSSQGEGKKGWFGGWFGKKDPNQQPGPIKAKLGEESSFVYDPDLKRWVNKKAGDTPTAAPKPPPPPKKSPTPVSQPPSSNPTPSSSAPTPPPTNLNTPPPPRRTPTPSSLQSASTPPPPGPSPSGPPPPGGPSSSRPTTSMSQRVALTGDSIDDLLGPPSAGMSRKSPAGGRKRGKNRYVEVIPGQN